MGQNGHREGSIESPDHRHHAPPPSPPRRKRKIAVIDISIHSTGADFKADGSEAAASVELTGQVTVNLDTMLDEQLELKGTVTTCTSKPGESTKVKLPIRLTATKSFVRDMP